MEELLESFILEALKLEVTDLHFKSIHEPVIYMRHKNKLKFFKQVSHDKHQRLYAYLKYKAKLDFNQLSKPQTGSFVLKINEVDYYFRLSYLPSLNDVHLVLRLLNHQKKILFNDLSDQQHTLDTFSNLLQQESGLIVVCGPTGSGKSTTLHCFLDQISQTQHKNIVTIEDPIEIHNERMIQIQVNENSGLTFETILEQVLRHDPDVIMIGELRNAYSASIALKLALTGHLVLTTLHASDGKTALKRLLGLELDQDSLQQVLLSIITQRLFYKKDTEEAFVVFETILRNDLVKLLHHEPADYQLLHDEIEDYYQKGWLNEEDYKKFTFF